MDWFSLLFGKGARSGRVRCRKVCQCHSQTIQSEPGKPLTLSLPGGSSRHNFHQPSFHAPWCMLLVSRWVGGSGHAPRWWYNSPPPKLQSEVVWGQGVIEFWFKVLWYISNKVFDSLTPASASASEPEPEPTSGWTNFGKCNSVRELRPQWPHFIGKFIDKLPLRPNPETNKKALPASCKIEGRRRGQSPKVVAIIDLLQMFRGFVCICQAFSNWNSTRPSIPMLSMFQISLSWALFLRLFVLYISNYIDQVTRPACVCLGGPWFNYKYLIDINLIGIGQHPIGNKYSFKNRSLNYN